MAAVLKFSQPLLLSYLMTALTTIEGTGDAGGEAMSLGGPVAAAVGLCVATVLQALCEANGYFAANRCVGRAATAWAMLVFCSLDVLDHR